MAKNDIYPPPASTQSQTADVSQCEWEEHAGACLWEGDSTSIIQCQRCGFAHIIPLPDEDELARFYGEAFYQREKSNYFNQSKADTEWLNLIFSDRYQTFEQLLGGRSGRLLDVGCGPGDCLYTGQERGWQVIGVEPAPIAVVYARQRGLDVREGSIWREDLAASGKFDVVHMSEVLEHVRDPHAIIARSLELLTPHGLLAVSVPNDFNPLQRVLCEQGGHASWWVSPRHHLNYFNFDSLKRLFYKHGLEPVVCEASFPMELFLLMGDNYVADPELGPKMHEKRKRLEQMLARAGQNELRREIYRALACLGIGRIALVVGRRSDR